jgi:glutamate dehydrogenase (NADP+)
MKELKLEDLQQNFSVHVEELNASPVVEYLRDKQDGLITDSQLKAIHHLLGFDTSKDIEILMLEEGTEYKSLLTNLTYSEGYIYDVEGIDAGKLAWVMDLKNARRGRISEYTKQYPNAQFVAGKRPWEVKAHIALPCATQNELNGEEAQALIANGVMCVAEGANMPSTPEAIAAFQAAKVLFAPGKASNAGGVATSGLEMSQNSLRLSWSAEEVDQRLHGIMVSIHEACVKYGKDADGTVDYVKGANVAGFVKVADAMIDQGVV